VTGSGSAGPGRHRRGLRRRDRRTAGRVHLDDVPARTYSLALSTDLSNSSREMLEAKEVVPDAGFEEAGGNGERSRRISASILAVASA